jgi:hypothetical protein
VVYRAEIVATGVQSLSRITDPSFDPSRSAVLEEQPPDWQEPSSEVPIPPTAAIADYRPDQVTIRVETVANGLLVLTDSYARGWQVTVDGQRAHLYVADHAFRAVQVPAGRHEVVFAYVPAAFRLGTAVTVVSLSVLAVVTAVLALAARRVRDPRGRDE